MSEDFWGESRVMGVDPSSRGFGYVVLEGPHQLIDWGVRQTRTDKNVKAIGEIRDLLEHYWPDVLVVEEYRTGPGNRRSSRICLLQNEIIALAARIGMECYAYPWERVRGTFERFGDTTKHGIACCIARLYPELHRRLPPPRQPWMSEDYRMSIFDATALALTHFMLKEAPRESRHRKGKA